MSSSPWLDRSSFQRWRADSNKNVAGLSGDQHCHALLRDGLRATALTYETSIFFVFSLNQHATRHTPHNHHDEHESIERSLPFTSH